MRTTTVVALVLAITVQSAHSYLGLNLGLSAEKSLDIGGFLGGILGKVKVDKSLKVNAGHGNGISIQKEGMISLGGNKWGFEKSGSASIGGSQGEITTTGHGGGSINIEGQGGYAQGQQSIHNEGHLHQNGGYEIGTQGNLIQNLGHYEKHSSEQNTHLGSSSSHFEQHGFQQSGSGQLTGHSGHVENSNVGFEHGFQQSGLGQLPGHSGHVHTGHVDNSNVAFGQQGFQQSGHDQIGDIFLVNQDKKSGNVHISSTGQSIIDVQQHGIEESNLGQTTGHSAHQTGGIIYELNTQGQKSENVHTGHVDNPNVGFEQHGFQQSGSGQLTGHSGHVHTGHVDNPNGGFGQQRFQQSGSGQLTGHSGHVHTGHVDNPNVASGQQGFEQSGHGQIGDIFLVNEDKKSGNVHISSTGQSKIDVQQHGIEESNLGQTTGHSAHQTGGIIYDLNTQIQKGENVHTGHVDSNDDIGQQGSWESNLGQIAGHSVHQTDGINYELNTEGKKGNNVHIGHVDSNGHFGQQGRGEPDYVHGKVKGSKQAGDIIVVIKDQNDGNVDKSNDRNQNNHFGQHGIDSNYDHIVIDGSQQGDIIVVIKDKNREKVHGSHDKNANIKFEEGVAQSGSSHVIGSSEHKTNDYNPIITDQSSGTVHNSQGSIKSDWSQVTGHSEDMTNDYDFKLHGQDSENVRNILSQNSKVNSEHGSVRGQGQTQSQFGDNQVQSQVQFGKGKDSEGSGLNKIFGFHKAGEILFGFEKPVGHDSHNKIEQNSNGHININRESSEEGSSVTGNKNSLIIANKDDHTPNIKVGVNNQNSAKESVSEESSLSLSHGSEHSSIVGVGQHANVHDSTGQIEVTKEMLNVGKTSHHSESSESSTHLKQGLWNSDFGFDKKVEKQSKVEISHHQKSSSLANHSQSSVQHDSHSSHSSSSHISSSHLKSSHSSSKFHQSMSSSHIGNLENSGNSGEGVIDIRVKP